MQVADLRRHFGDHFAVGPQHQAQDAVRAGMLRPHIDQHLVRAHVEFDGLGIACSGGSGLCIDQPGLDTVVLGRHV